MPIPNDAAEHFRTEVSLRLRDAIERKFTSTAEAAAALGISRQRLHQYLRKAAIPRADILLWAIKEWGFDLDCYGVRFGIRSARSRKHSAALSENPVQLELFDEPQVLSNDLLEIKVVRKESRSLKLNLEIKLAS